MSAQAAEHTDPEQPLIPMPPVSEAPLRAAVKRLDPAAAVTYEQEFHAAWEEGLQSDSTGPMHTFLRRWAIYVAVHRYPARSARLHHLEETSSTSDNRAAVHRAAEEISRM